MAQDPHEIARLSAAAMWADDKASPALGMAILAVGPGTAMLAMTVGPTMVNGLGICHGGFIFTLADSACAFASNSYNQRAVLQTGEIFLIAPARVGTSLIAEASERHRGERSGIYDVAVRTEAGEAIAEFRGHVRTIPGTLIPNV
ncbi:MAG: hydroxyphenylacetyl-CoA thioesterase PaaI [Hyphomicrobiaceae bacterium]